MTLQKEYPPLETKRLYLRELNLEDTPFIFKLYSDETVCKYLYDADLFTTYKEAENFIIWNLDCEGKNHNRWGIMRKADHSMLGTIGFHSWDRVNHIAEIGYDLLSEYWGKGYMTEALEGVIKNGFKIMKLNRIHAYVALNNQRSIQLLEKLHFKKEGIFRDRLFFSGQYHDHYCYSLLKREWK
ncbi:ribosomal-protein-alanine N-acetyltransferase [Bacillus oleivorans]|uniref:Ribosomal-protein-alanine N-acetyltransferase n=1 Tax=Bacillus oleivorans TaxID=1448271 RepID=A0A285CSC8_9BACI|nr:GNAT family protein [Bacillus oleivorans]SNX70335.1 ribosomal-protein-alanine N-acetyltransferase [Bacillus oleivorans]